MKAQTVKNAVIVPVGAKGGFVVKRPPTEGGRAALQAEGIECYKTLIRGLLDVTDNLVAGEVAPPQHVVRRDGDDPYLVVAADKGTATFSDIANGVAREYGFWLDDAFASGGSSGYDHKAMGITARGAWESVKRHFRELGRNTQREPFTVVGVGDMSGDVFGNGMLQSRCIRLIGAFDHRHIFCDPDPEPAVSFEERLRLFNLPGSSWANYDSKLLSQGGAVFERSAKLIRPSPEIRASFGIAEEALTPAALISAMLKSTVDLLWFGGIGTYVKASWESHADANDKTNDPLRVNGADLRAKVVGEGANLGVTQHGRVEFALRGGRINTDFIDNSAGVDTSDHEVNIKILLRDIVSGGELSIAQRDELLAAMTDEVAGLVLRDNYQQTQALSVVERSGAALLESHARFIRGLEKAGQLDRSLEGLPDEEEFADRSRERQGLTRPELSVLLARSKMTLYDALLSSGLPDERRMAEDLVAYFPAPLRTAYGSAIERHRLRREIIATEVANSLVNRLGPTFVNDIAAESGQEPSEIARAYAVAREVFGLRDLWHEIEELDGKVEAALQLDLLIATVRLCERAVPWFLQFGNQPLEVGAEAALYAPGVKLLTDHLEAVLSPSEAAARTARLATLTQQGISELIAIELANVGYLGAALDVVRIARHRGVEVPKAAEVYFALGQRFGIEWLRLQARTLTGANYWQNEAIEAIAQDLNTLQAEIASNVLETSRPDENGREAVAGWVDRHAALAGRIDVLLAEIRAAPSTDLAMIGLATRRLRTLATS
jgi:glutamate dehydrogenase